MIESLDMRYQLLFLGNWTTTFVATSRTPPNGFGSSINVLTKGAMRHANLHCEDFMGFHMRCSFCICFMSSLHLTSLPFVSLARLALRVIGFHASAEALCVNVLFSFWELLRIKCLFQGPAPAAFLRISNSL